MLRFPKGPTRAYDKAIKARRRDTTRKQVYALVTRRDHGRCRVCGKPSTHHHHIRFRSAGGSDSSENLVSLCVWCHQKIHDHDLTVTGNADSTLTFEDAGGVRHG